MQRGTLITIAVIIALVVALIVVSITIDTEQNETGNGTSTNSNTSSVEIERTFDTKVVYTTDMSASTSPLKIDCQQRGGVFKSCGSVCAPDAAACTQQCAYVCDLD